MERATVARRRFLRTRSFWDALLAAAVQGPPAYDGYSYRWRADLFRLTLGAEQAITLSAAAKSLAPRDMQRNLLALDRASHIVFVCARDSA